MTRMWIGVPVESLCTSHLLGEWNEMHKIAGSLKTGSMSAIKQGAYLNVDTSEFTDRAHRLYGEMLRRGYDADDSILSYEPPTGIGAHSSDVNRRALSQRCNECEVTV